MPSLKKGFIAILLLLIAMTMVIAGCGSEEDSQDKPQQGGELNIGYLVDITSFDPIKGTTGNDHVLLWPVYDTLVRFTPDMRPEPGLAESWEFPDENTVVLYLREGVKFHDDTPFNADAVKFNIDRINSEDSLIGDLKDIADVEVVDDTTVKLHLAQPNSSILMALSDRGGMMVSPTAINTYGDDYPLSPVGAGPFRMVNHVPYGEIEYEAFEDYWQEGLPYLDKITVKIIPEEVSQINALKSGQVDFIMSIPAHLVSSVENDSNIALSIENTFNSILLYVRTGEEPFNNREARLALLHGIDRQQLIDSINFGLGDVAYQPFPKGYWAYDDSIDIAYDPDKARQYLEDSGLEDVSMTIVTFPIDWWQRLASAIQGQLEEIGITVEIEALEANAAVAMFLGEKQEAEALTGNWSGRPDPQLTVVGLYSINSFFNPDKRTTPNLETLIAEAAATYDQDERAALYKQIVNEVIVQEAFQIPLFFPPNAYAMSHKVKGFEPNFLGKPLFAEFWVE